MTQHQVPVPENNTPLFNPRIISRVALIWASIALIAQAIFMGLTGALK